MIIKLYTGLNIYRPIDYGLMRISNTSSQDSQLEEFSISFDHVAVDFGLS